MEDFISKEPVLTSKSVYRLLIVEDSESDAALLVHHLERQGLSIHSVRVDTSEELSAQLEEPDWDIVLSDYVMPRFSAPDALEIIRLSGRDIPFVIISGSIGEEAAVAMMKAGAHDFLMKDSLGRLTAVIEREVSDARSRRQHKAAEIALQEREQRWNFALEGSGVGVWDWDIAAGRFYFSPQLRVMLGFPPEEHIGDLEEFNRRIHWDDRERVLSERNLHLLGETPLYITEYRLIQQPGAFKWVLDRGKVMTRTPEGKPLRLIGTLTDITTQKRAEIQARYESRVLELLAADAPLTKLLETLIEGFEVLVPERIGSILLCDAEARRLRHGAAPGLPEEYIRLVDGVVIETGAGSCGTAAAERRKVVATDVQTDPNWMKYQEIAAKFNIRACWSTPILSSKGAVLGTFAVYARKASTPDAWEDSCSSRCVQMAAIALERREAAAQLIENRARLHSIVFSALDAIITLDERQCITLLNPAAETMFGASASRLLGQHIGELIRDPAEIDPNAPTKNDSGGSSLAAIRTIEAQRSDGEVFTAEISVSVIPMGKGSLSTVILRDVSERKSLERQLLQAQRMEAIGQLSGGIAHDFNNVLTIIRLNVANIQSRVDLPQDVTAGALEIADAAERAARLTQHLVACSKREIDTASAVDINELVDEMLRLLRRVVGDHITLKSQLGPLLPPIQGNRGLIEQVLLNLAVNARDAMPQGGQLYISTSMVEVLESDPYLRRVADSSVGTFVRVSVRDSGSGIHPDHLPHIFEPFFTTKDVGKGSGLGLASAYGIARQHRGWIEVTTQLGLGTTFDVYLPTTTHPLSEQQARRPAEDVTLPKGKETILVVEDEGLVRRLLETLLLRLGYHVISAENGPAAINLWETRGLSANLLLTDIVMPGGMTGKELAGRLREQKPDLRVVYTSSHKDMVPDDISPPCEEIVEGVNFLQKPYSPTDLAQMIRRQLDGPEHQSNGLPTNLGK